MNNSLLKQMLTYFSKVYNLGEKIKRLIEKLYGDFKHFADIVVTDALYMKEPWIKGQDSKAKKYMWLYKTGEPKNSIILYDYQRTRFSATIYSVVETAEANGLIVEKYPVYLIDVLCNMERIDKDTLLKYMPWFKELPEDVRLQNKNIHGKND